MIANHSRRRNDPKIFAAPVPRYAPIEAVRRRDQLAVRPLGWLRARAPAARTRRRHLIAADRGDCGRNHRRFLDGGGSGPVQPRHAGAPDLTRGPEYFVGTTCV